MVLEKDEGIVVIEVELPEIVTLPDGVSGGAKLRQYSGMPKSCFPMLAHELM